MMEGMGWVVEIKEELQSMGDVEVEMEKWRKHSIYKIPASVKELNRKAFSPQTVSFGPRHNGEEELMGMEEHKRRALLHFLKRCGKPIELLVHCMDQILQDLYDSYEPLDTCWKKGKPRFLKLMILDGCFMLEIMRIDTRNVDNDYAPDDPVFSEHGRQYIIPYIKRDMYVLENQLPMKVLETLIEFEGRTTTQQGDEWLNKLIHEFFFPGKPRVERMGKCLHALDVYRKILVRKRKGGTTLPPTPSRRKKGRKTKQLRSVTELNEAGVSFKSSKSISITEVSFKGGVLKLPEVIVDDTAETKFLNLIAFERFHVGAGHEVTSFVFFMDNIINHERDVALLHSKGIITNALGSDKAVADLFNSLTRDIAVGQESTLVLVQDSIIDYSRKPWNKWRANLLQTYCRNPWVLISVVAAIFLFGLTIVQTVYGILPYYKKDPCPPPYPAHHHPLMPRISRGHI